MGRYAHIAAMLPRKQAQDVAFRVAWLRHLVSASEIQVPRVEAFELAWLTLCLWNQGDFQLTMSLRAQLSAHGVSSKLSWPPAEEHLLLHSVELAWNVEYITYTAFHCPRRSASSATPASRRCGGTAPQAGCATLAMSSAL